ncbi:MAG: hypothetical protein JNM43_03475 [Planctomycetaceae bacterium]|nr:hypothetical protein [Planctomycetaceae bacterium]
MSDESSQRLGLFDAYGVELEYMIVAKESLDVQPVCDRLIEAECGAIQSDVERGEISWSNELVLHVVELKTTGPSASLQGLSSKFHSEVRQINRRLGDLGCRLMPSAMHPWMDPFREMRLWPHDYSVVYETFNRIFDCRGHGWANLQSVHLNLPFNGDEEFGKLHAAIRLILPLLPALAASSPLAEGRLTGRMDQRLHVYRSNSSKIPGIAGKVIPEQAYTEADYHRMIFEPMFKEIAPFDPEGVLQDEFLNARGAIARFGRGSIEIRVIDIQECPAADLAVLQLVVSVLRALVEERWGSMQELQSLSIDSLFAILLSAIDKAEQAVVEDSAVLKLLGMEPGRRTVQEIWQSLYERLNPTMEMECRNAIEVILNQGPLARRIQQKLSRDSSMLAITDVALDLCDCLANGTQYLPKRRS